MCLYFKQITLIGPYENSLQYWSGILKIFSFHFFLEAGGNRPLIGLDDAAWRFWVYTLYSLTYIHKPLMKL